MRKKVATVGDMFCKRALYRLISDMAVMAASVDRSIQNWSGLMATNGRDRLRPRMPMRLEGRMDKNRSYILDSRAIGTR